MRVENRIRRHIRVRKYLSGTKICPRLAVFRSSKHIYAQIIEDNLGKTIVWASDAKISGTKMEKAYEMGKKLAEKALKNNITTVVFDRGGFLYHGRVAEVARGAREGGLKL